MHIWCANFMRNISEIDTLLKNEEHTFLCFSKFAETKTGVVYGGTPYADDKKVFSKNKIRVKYNTNVINYLINNFNLD